MTNAERIAGLEDAVIHLSNIVELRFGLYADNTTNPRVVAEGEQFHRWWNPRRITGRAPERPYATARRIDRRSFAVNPAHNALEGSVRHRGVVALLANPTAGTDRTRDLDVCWVVREERVDA